MARIRNLYRPTGRCTMRRTTRMLAAAHRPAPPDYLALACRALSEVMRIDKRLRPYMEEQKQMMERRLFEREIDDALRKIYGPESSPGQHVGQTSGLPVGGLPRSEERRVGKECKCR